MLIALIAATLVAADPQVWIFARTDCPVSNRHAPTLEKLYQKYSSANIRFLLIYPEPGATKTSVEKHREEYRLSMPYEIDARHERARRAGIRVTPEVAVYGSNGALVYRGRIDDRDAILGVTRQHRRVRNDLEEVLSAIANGKSPPFRSTLAIGCAMERPE